MDKLIKKEFYQNLTINFQITTNMDYQTILYYII